MLGLVMGLGCGRWREIAMEGSGSGKMEVLFKILNEIGVGFDL